MRKLIPAAILIALCAAPSTGRYRTDVPAATPTGPALDCVSLTDLRDSEVRNDRVIDFRTHRGKLVYRVTLPYECPELGFERAFAYETSLSQLCSNDIITVLHQGGGLLRGASCGMGKFQPVQLDDPRR